MAALPKYASELPGSNTARASAARGSGGLTQLLGSIAVVSVLVLALFGPNMSVGSGDSGQGSAVRQALYLLTFVVAAASAQPWLRPARLLVLPLTMLAVLAWCWLSLSWAIEPSSTLRRLILTTILIWTIFLAVRSAGYSRTLMLFRAVMLTVIVASLATVFLLPQIGIHQQPDVADPALVGAWRGLLMQKNFAGAAAAVTILLFAFDARHIKPVVRLAAIAVTAVFLAGTLSKTSIGICGAALVIGWLLRHYNPALRMYLLPASLIAGTIAVLFLVQQWNAIFVGLEQDHEAFTGRAELWTVLLRFAGDHPILGAGYGSFWNIGGGKEPVFDYATGWVTGQSSGHNGYLDVLVAIGLPGLILALLAFIVLPLARLLTSFSVGRSQGALLVALIFFCAGHNFTESSLLERDIAVNVFLLFAIALAQLTTRSAAPYPPTRKDRPNG